MSTYAVTIPSARVSPLILPERCRGFNVRYTVLYSDVAVASATGSTDVIAMALGTTPTNWVVGATMAYVTTAFAGTTALTMVVGTTTTTNAFLQSTSILTAGVIQPATGIFTVNTPASSTGTTALGIQATFTNATGGSPSALTAGVLEILLEIVNPDAFY